MELAVILSGAAIVAHLLAYALYLWLVCRRPPERAEAAGRWSVFNVRPDPKAASWLPWIYIAALNSTSFHSMTNDWLKAMPMFTPVLGCLAVTVATAWLKRWGTMPLTDLTSFAVAIAATTVWAVSREAQYANLSLQLAAIISFAPIILGLLRRTDRENPLPWLVFSAAYLLNGSVVVLRWSGHWQDAVALSVDFSGHLLIGLLALRAPRAAKPALRPLSA
ncbi:MAG: hypothetical protein PHT12_01660 [Patescibacteria group bacterium]|nr:hypothetical protein [Patescibacteria group bacterium]